MLDDEDFSESWGSRAKAQIIDGLDLKSLRSGKGLTFETRVNESESIQSLGSFLENLSLEESDELNSLNWFTHRENEGIPDVPFEILTQDMQNLDESGWLKKKLLRAGGGPKPTESSIIFVHYQLFLEGHEEPFDSTRLRKRRARYSLKNKEVLPGFEGAVLSMQARERSCFLISHQLAFGQQGAPPRVPPEATILAEIELLNIADAKECGESFDLGAGESHSDFASTIRECKSLQIRGNEAVRKSSYKEAARRYYESLKLLDALRLSDSEEEGIMVKLKTTVYVNLAVTMDKLNQPEKVCILCREALALNPNHDKALFHYGRANLKLSNFPLAAKYLRQGMAITKCKKDFEEEFKRLEAKQKSSKDWERDCYRKALGLPNEIKKDNFSSEFTETLREIISGKKGQGEYIVRSTLTESERSTCERLCRENNIPVVFLKNVTKFYVDQPPPQ